MWYNISADRIRLIVIALEDLKDKFLYSGIEVTYRDRQRLETLLTQFAFDNTSPASIRRRMFRKMRHGLRHKKLNQKEFQLLYPNRDFFEYQVDVSDFSEEEKDPFPLKPPTP